MKFKLYVLSISIFFLIFLISSVSAITYLNIYVEKDGSALLLGQTTESFLNLPSGVSIEEGKIIGKTDDLTYKEDGLWIFNYSLKNSEINVIIPSSFVIKNLSKLELSYGEKTISIYGQDSVFFSYKQNNYPIFLIFLCLVISLLIIFFIFYLKSHKTEPKKNKKSIKKDKLILNLLNDREKEIIKSLKISGKIKISQLRRLTNIPKSSLSRHIQELEKKKIVKRSGEGKNKFVQMIN